MRQLPTKARCYKKTPVFDEKRVPEARRREHRTAKGVWGVIRVLEGSLRLHILEPEPEERLLDSDHPAVIAPQQTHRVELLGPVRFQIEFYRKEEDV